MRIIIQRVRNASVTIEGVEHSAINQGMMILVGIEEPVGQGVPQRYADQAQLRARAAHRLHLLHHR